MFLAFEESLRRTLDEGDVDDINEKLSPKALTKCDTNALLMAMEVSSMPKPFIFELKLSSTVILYLFPLAEYLEREH